jgi:ATP-dependent Lon protease
MAFVSLCSSALNLPVQDSLALVGNVTIGGVQQKVTNLADVLQVAFDAGAKRVLMPAANATDIATVPPDLFARFQINFYSGPEDAVRKAVGRL